MRGRLRLRLVQELASSSVNAGKQFYLSYERAYALYLRYLHSDLAGLKKLFLTVEVFDGTASNPLFLTCSGSGARSSGRATATDAIVLIRQKRKAREKP